MNCTGVNHQVVLEQAVLVTACIVQGVYEDRYSQALDGESIKKVRLCVQYPVSLYQKESIYTLCPKVRHPLTSNTRECASASSTVA